MTDNVDLDPDELRTRAAELERYAEAMRKWGEIPHDWLNEFPDGYGTISAPMHGALTDYYRKRHEKAEEQAASAMRTRADLLAAAERLENSELSGGTHISNAGPHGGPAPIAHNPGGPGSNAPNRPLPQAVSQQSTPVTIPDDPTTPVGVGRPHDVSTPTAAAVPQPGQVSGPAFSGSTIAAPVGLSASVPSPDHHVHQAHPASPNHEVHADDSVPVLSVGSGYAGYNAGYVAGEPAEASIAGGSAPMGPFDPGPGGPPSGPPLGPLPSGPLAASAYQTRGRRGLPALEIGTSVDDDLMLARTLLSAVLFAIGDTAPGIDWATAVMRDERGAAVLLTSSEGRGWLPPGLYLPSEVSIPWQWDSMLDEEGRAAMATFENTSDPAQVLTYFGHHAARCGHGRLQALASSERVADDLRATLGSEVAVAGGVVAAESAVDLSRPGMGLSDRLDIAGSPVARQRAAEIPDSEIRSFCLQLARSADQLARHAVSGADPEILVQQIRRRRVMKSLHTGGGMNATALRPAVTAPIDSTGAPSRSLDAEIERGRAFERRVDELISLLLSGSGDRRMLRDVLYAHDQIAEHPQVRNATWTSSAAAGISGGNVDSGARAVISSPGVDGVSMPASSAFYGEQRSIR